MWRPSVSEALAFLASFAPWPGRAPVAETTRAARTLNARRRAVRRQRIAAHIAKFGPAGERGLQILNEGTRNV